MKIFTLVYASLLMLFSLKLFKANKEFKNKRIAVIGAADSVFKQKNGKIIDGYDIVIRVNKAPHSWKQNDKEYLGSKFNLLYHSFFENNFSGGGPIDWEYFDLLGIEKVINPIHTKKGLTAHLNYYRRHQKFKDTYMLSSKDYRQASKELQGYKPTIGYMALSTVLNSRCKEIFITGFTFFKTSYAKGYRDELQDIYVNKTHIEQQGLHNPELEFQAFKKALSASPCKSILMDEDLLRILQQGELKG